MKDIIKSTDTLREGSIGWPGISTKKRKPSKRLKGVAG